MNKQIIVVFVLVGLIAIGVSVAVLKSPTFLTKNSSSQFKDVELRIGAISASPKKASEEYSLLAGYLKSKLGVKNVSVVIARTSLEMAVLLKQGKEDVVIDNPFASYALQNSSNSEIVLGSVENDSPSYRSVYIVTKKSKIKNTDDLKGKMIAFKQNNSASAYFLPKADLLRRGVKLVEKEGPTSKVSPDETGYYFSNDNDATIEHLYKGKVEVGAMSESNYSEKLGEYPDTFRVLDYTADISGHVVSFRKDFDSDLKTRISEALLNAGSDLPGKTALESIDLQGFKKIEKGSEIDKNMEELSSILQNETLTY